MYFVETFFPPVLIHPFCYSQSKPSFVHFI